MSLLGFVDALSDVCISGWAADDSNFECRVSVQVIVNSSLIAVLPCVQFREDLRALGMGDGYHGFTFDPAAYLTPGRNQLEVRYAGTDLILPRGAGHWVRIRDGALSGWEKAFIAALEAYYQFTPKTHICGIGACAGELERILRKAQLPFRTFTNVGVPRPPAAAALPQKADVVICWAYARPSAECVRVLSAIVHGNMKRPGLLAAGFTDTPDASGDINQAFAESGIAAVHCDSLALAPVGPRRIFAFGEVSDVPRIRTEVPPVFAHIHIPKCAGTSLRVLLTRYFGARHLLLYVDDTYFVYGDETLRSHLLQDPEVRGFSSHHVRGFPRWMAGREMLYITFLRDPVQQFVSYMTHFKKYYATITSRSLLEAVPPDALDLPLREFARWLLTNDRDIPFRENHNVNFLTRHNSPAAVNRLAAAKHALEGFFFVGITERMDVSMQMLLERARAAGLDFPSDPIPVENTSSDCRDDLSWINPDDEVGALLFQSVQQDRQLYDWAVERFDALADQTVAAPASRLLT